VWLHKEVQELWELSPTLLGRVTRKQGTDSLAWEYWRVQGAEDAVMGTRAESLHILDLLVFLLANCTYLSQTPLTHMQVIGIMVGQLLPLAAYIPVGPC